MQNQMRMQTEVECPRVDTSGSCLLHRICLIQSLSHMLDVPRQQALSDAARAADRAVGRHVSLAPGEAAAITGPSGSGKSSLLYMLGALEPPSRGR